MGLVYLQYQDESVEIPEGDTVVGRDVGCALRFNDPSMSRRHLRIARRGDDITVQDLGSANGTRVNGLAVKAPTRVKHDDVIQVGSRELTIRYADEIEADTVTLQLVGVESLDDLPPAASRSVTRPIASVSIEHLTQRCPGCGMVVSLEDDECASCGYEWGTFRASSPTQERPNPLGRRRAERRSVELHLIYQSAELEIEAQTRDLSEAGVFVCTKIFDPVGTRCFLTLLIDGTPSLRVQGVVRRVVERPAPAATEGLGIEFTSMTDGHREWLRSVLERAR